VKSVGGKIYKGSTIEECIDRACQELGLEKEKLVYTITEEKKGFFKKSVSISVESQDKKASLKNGTVKVENGVLIVKDPVEGGRPAMIQPTGHLKLFIDREETGTRQEVRETNLVEVHFEDKEAQRHMNVSVSPDKMKAHITIEYTPRISYCLKDGAEANHFILEAVIKEEQYPPAFTAEEIKKELQKMGICSGIIEENVNSCSERGEISNLLIAEGTPVVNDTDDRMEIKFNQCKNPLEQAEDSGEKIDFRNLGAIDVVNKGDLLGVKISGQVGSDGKDIFGNVAKKKDKRQFNLRIGAGCILQDENTVTAAISGKPCIKNNVFYVYQVHEVTNDVDIKTGNIAFVGDVIVYGSVKEGMKIEAGNGVEIGRDVEHADIRAKGNITVKGNILISKVAAGGEDIVTQRLMINLSELKSIIKTMTDTVMEIKKFNLLGQKITDGEIVKVLIENKFKAIPKLCISIIGDTRLQQSDAVDPVVTLIKQKLLAMAPLNIYHFSELDEIIEAVDQRLKELEGLLSLPVDVNIAYCQDSHIASSGNVFITGKGEYVSHITANHGVYFLEERAVARGGTIKARDEIKCRKVGSTGGVSTKLWVEEKGHIWADIAFQNTTFAIGTKEYILEKPSKNVHAYMDRSGDIVVDKLYL
jgi:uncharacterized protein